jgi:hypothetical protein
MWYLYLDESGDLGFDFFTKRPSNYFTVSILLVKSVGANRVLLNAAKKSRRRKLRREGELKGSKTSIAVKKHFYAQVADTEFPLDIYHHTSHENVGLQIADLFAWGLFRRHERNDWEWRNCFQKQVAYDGRYL